MRRPLALLAVPLLLLASPDQPSVACPRLELTLAALVSRAELIVVGQVAAIRDVAGQKVAEVRAIDLLKGEVAGDTFFYPLRSVFWEEEAEPRVEERAVLFLGTSEGFEGSRAFWTALDRLRGHRPFFDLAPYGFGRLAFQRPASEGEDVVRLEDVRLPPDLPAWPPDDVDPASDQRMVYASTLVEAIRELAARPADPSGPGRTGAPRDDGVRAPRDDGA